MNIAVIYLSRNGNTGAVAEVIAKTVGVTAKTISEPVEENVDMLFIGSGTYMLSADKAALDFIQKLKPKQVGQIVAFSTAGMENVAVKKMSSAAKEVGLSVNENSLCVRMLAKGHKALGKSGGNLSEKQIENISAFARKVMGE